MPIAWRDDVALLVAHNGETSLTSLSAGPVCPAVGARVRVVLGDLVVEGGREALRVTTYDD